MQNFILSLWIACLAFEKASNKHPFFENRCIIYWKSFLFPIKTSQSYVSYHHTLWQLDFCDAKSILECWATLVYQKSIYLTNIKKWHWTHSLYHLPSQGLLIPLCYSQTLWVAGQIRNPWLGKFLSTLFLSLSLYQCAKQRIYGSLCRGGKHWLRLGIPNHDN